MLPNYTDYLRPDSPMLHEISVNCFWTRGTHHRESLRRHPHVQIFPYQRRPQIFKMQTGQILYALFHGPRSGAVSDADLFEVIPLAQDSLEGIPNSPCLRLSKYTCYHAYSCCYRSCSSRLRLQDVLHVHGKGKGFNQKPTVREKICSIHYALKRRNVALSCRGLRSPVRHATCDMRLQMKRRKGQRT